MSLAGAWILNSIAGYHSIMAIILFPLWILSGAMFPMEDGWQRIVAAANPLSYFVDGVRLGMTGRSLASAEHLPVLAGLAAVVLITLTAAFLSMRRTGVQAV